METKAREALELARRAAAENKELTSKLQAALQRAEETELDAKLWGEAGASAEAKLKKCEGRLDSALAEIAKLKARYTWAANELLACDYGDNDHPSRTVGWHVYGWRYRQDRIDRRIYGDSIDMAIDLELVKTQGVPCGGCERVIPDGWKYCDECRPDHSSVVETPVCKFEGCSERVYYGDWCKEHYPIYRAERRKEAVVERPVP